MNKPENKPDLSGRYHQNCTLELLALELKAAQTIADAKPEHVKKVAEYEAEVARLSQAVDQVRSIGGAVDMVIGPPTGNLITSNPSVGQQYAALLSISDSRLEESQRELERWKAAVVNAEHAAIGVEAIKDFTKQREAQEKRFGGFLGFNKPFGQEQFILTADSDLLRDMNDLAYGRVNTQTRAEQIQMAVKARWAKAQADFARWEKENEVWEIGIREVHRTSDSWSADTCILYRAICTREGITNFHTLDPAARFLQLPFRREDVEKNLGFHATPALLSRWVVSEDKGRFHTSSTNDLYFQ